MYSLRSRLIQAVAALLLLVPLQGWAASPALHASTQGGCVSPAAIQDASGAVARNAGNLASPELCLAIDTFNEGPLHWQLLIVRNRAAAHRILWVVPHDDEGDAFDTAVYGVRTYGGTIVAVKTGGNRMNGPQDPNRNFDAGGRGRCRSQVARSPVYTRRVLRWWNGKAPILALHTNERGYEGDGQGGRGTISIARRTPGLTPFRASAPIGESPDDTMIYVASQRPPQKDHSLMRLVTALKDRGINVAYELVSPAHSDCSLSNYAALAGAPRYVNLEVARGDGQTQRRMVETVLDLSGIHQAAP